MLVHLGFLPLSKIHAGMQIDYSKSPLGVKVCVHGDPRWTDTSSRVNSPPQIHHNHDQDCVFAVNVINDMNDI